MRAFVFFACIEARLAATKKLQIPFAFP